MSKIFDKEIFNDLSDLRKRIREVKEELEENEKQLENAKTEEMAKKCQVLKDLAKPFTNRYLEEIREIEYLLEGINRKLR